MKRVLALAIFAAALASAPVLRAANPPLSPELQKLNVSVGRWIYHGKTLKPRAGTSGSWTWNEDCRWSSDQTYLECTFTNDWSGKVVKSLVVDTYNTKDHSFWHYELYASGVGGNHPFVSRMAIHGNTWIEYTQQTDHGKKTGERVVYRFSSPTRVSVKIQVSRDGAHWVTMDRGEGVKQP